MESQGCRILREGDTCWRIAKADRAAVLVDGEAYFAAVRAAILSATRSVYLIGWDIDSRTDLAPAGADDDAPTRLRELLEHCVERNPDLVVHVLLWDFSMLYALEREPLPTLSLDWKTPRRIRVCLDGYLPLGASHHQKIVVVDDSLAFCGGLDLTIRRWDTRAHAVDDARRVDPGGEPYQPFHDAQMMVDGDAAAALARVARGRWSDARCEKAPPLAAGGDRWPRFVEPDFEGIPVGIARTMPELDERSEIREVERLYVEAIRAARATVYIENQYVSSAAVVEALIERMNESTDLEVIIVSRGTGGGWLEEQSMRSGRVQFSNRLCANVDEARLRLLYPTVGDGDDEVPINVHAKIMIVDDDFLRIGSSNLNNRSQGLDTECDLAIEARTGKDRETVRRIRDDLLAEHLGVDAEDVAEARERAGSLIAAVDGIEGRGRRLLAIEDDVAVNEEWARSLRSVADPEGPIDPEEFVGDLYAAEERTPRRRRVAVLVAIALGVLSLLALWQYTPLAGLTDYQRVEPWLDALERNAFAFALVPLIYVLASLVFFPVTALITLTALTFGAWLGFVYAVIGALAGAAATFWIGEVAGRTKLRGLMGNRIDRVSRKLADKGVITVITSRVVPVAPFSLINLVAGAAHIRFRDFIIGTFVGMAPGIAVMTALGDGLRRVWQQPSAWNVTVVAAAILAWLALSVGLQVLVTRWGARRRRRNDDG